MSSSVETENAIGKTDKEEIITPYPEREYDVEGEQYASEGYKHRVRDHRSTLQRIAEIEEEIIESMHKNSVGAVYRTVDYLQYWMPDYVGPDVDEAAANLKRRIKAGIIVKPPRKRLTYEEFRERYSSTFTEQEEP